MKDFVRPLVSAPAKVIVEVIDLARPLVMELVLERVPVRDLKRRLISEPDRDREPENVRAKPLTSREARPAEPVRAFPIPLVSDVTSERDTEKDLRYEYFSTAVRDWPRDPETVVEQERGLELQMIFPESTFATMLPITNVSKAARFLTMVWLAKRLVT